MELKIKQVPGSTNVFEPILLNGEEIYPVEMDINLSARDSPMVTIIFPLKALDLELTNFLLANSDDIELVQDILKLKARILEAG